MNYKKALLLPGLILVLILLQGGCQADRNKQKLELAKEKFIQSVYKNLVFVKGGSFEMGEKPSVAVDENGNKEKGYWSTSPEVSFTHRVELDSYSIQKYEVTYADYDFYTSLTKKKRIQQDFDGYEIRGPNYPAGADWQQAQDYCDWLSSITGESFSLPTEAQWEYAARSRGQNVVFATPSGRYEKKNSGLSDTLPVGSYDPNPLGLYDMTTNVQEWVWDWYSYDYYKNSPVKNPKGPETGSQKVLRGGALSNTKVFNTVYTRSSREIYYYKKLKYFKLPAMSMGFRCVLNKKKPVLVK
ncbi:MAG: formylglycine-generating enzyme family protein [Desulfobacteraceae bacterium]|nr:formylglycine-generating enzyme family protein [Desulfobacteraceae bacterium]